MAEPSLRASEQKGSRPEGRLSLAGILESETTLHHGVVHIVEHRGGLFLSILLREGINCNGIAFTVEEDDINPEFFEDVVVGVERRAERGIHNVCHSCKSLEVYYCAPGRV